MRRYLITGASRGIGRAIAERLAAPGVELLLNGRDEEALAEVCEGVRQQGAQAVALPFDLSHTSEIKEWLKQLGDEPVDLLVNNAGVAVVKPFEEVSLAEWERTLAVNVTAPFVLVRELVPRMPPGGAIANILSIAARTGIPGWSSYCMSKFALEGFTQSLREELRARKLRVINLYPAATRTHIWQSVPGEWDREKMMSPKQVAAALAFALEQPPSVLVESIALGDLAGTL